MQRTAAIAVVAVVVASSLPAAAREPTVAATHGGGSGPRPPRVCLITAYYGTSLQLRPITWPNKLRYAERWGYPIVDLTDDELATGLATSLPAEPPPKDQVRLIITFW